MSKMLVTLGAIAVASGTLATRLIWTLWTDPVTMAAALTDGSVRLILSALVGGH